MKRDMDLIRKIIFKIEDHPHGYYQIETKLHNGNTQISCDIEIEGYSSEEIKYNSYLIQQAGLADGYADQEVLGCKGPGCTLKCLTWKGHEFAELARSDTSWQKSKVVCKKLAWLLDFRIINSLFNRNCKKWNKRYD